MLFGVPETTKTIHINQMAYREQKHSKWNKGTERQIFLTIIYSNETQTFIGLYNMRLTKEETHLWFSDQIWKNTFARLKK